VEEDRFANLLKTAIPTAERSLAAAQKASPTGAPPILPGDEAFRLYDTFGLPLDLLEDLAGRGRVTVDRAGYEVALDQQRERARQASKMGAVKGDPLFLKLLEDGKTRFLGYETLVTEQARVLAVVKDGKLVPRLDAGEEGGILLDETPFYGESGGQVGDRGTLASGSSAAEVIDASLPVPGLYLHHVKVTAGSFEKGMTVRPRWTRAGAPPPCAITRGRISSTRRCATPWAPHVKQAGSLVSPDRLRFDFSHYAGLDGGQLRNLENQVNEQILLDHAVREQVMGREEALQSGALAFFGDKYGEQVRVVEVPASPGSSAGAPTCIAPGRSASSW
jgi:alanyl-tRNA synthetase